MLRATSTLLRVSPPSALLSPHCLLAPSNASTPVQWCPLVVFVHWRSLISTLPNLLALARFMRRNKGVPGFYGGSRHQEELCNPRGRNVVGVTATVCARKTC